MLIFSRHSRLSEKCFLSTKLLFQCSNYSSNVLDINGSDPDIVYGVGLYKITCGLDTFINYEIATMNYTSNTVDPYQIYKAVITPRNNVEGARNGTSAMMEGEYDNHYFRYSIRRGIYNGVERLSLV